MDIIWWIYTHRTKGFILPSYLCTNYQFVAIDIKVFEDYIPMAKSNRCNMHKLIIRSKFQLMTSHIISSQGMTVIFQFPTIKTKNCNSGQFSRVIMHRQLCLGQTHNYRKPAIFSINITNYCYHVLVPTGCQLQLQTGSLILMFSINTWHQYEMA